jgi:mRNA-degrading endonuclease toxin of MazEF toxin-antitoxin module
MNTVKSGGRTSKPRAWEVWLADVDFEGTAGHKRRPVLVLSAKGPSFTVLEITSQAPRLITDIEIRDISSAGLDKRSVIRTDKKRTIGQNGMIHKTGDLPSECRGAVKSALDFRKSMESDD